MGQAADLDEFKDALRAVGIPWVNTIAADRYGNASTAISTSGSSMSLQRKYNNCISGTAADAC